METQYLLAATVLFVLSSAEGRLYFYFTIIVKLMKMEHELQ